MWVEPVTGIVVVGQQEGKQELLAEGQEPGEGTMVFDGTLRFTDETINDNVTKAEDDKSKLSLLTSWPIAMWVAGGLLLSSALVMLISGARRGGRYGTDEPLGRRTTAGSGVR